MTAPSGIAGLVGREPIGAALSVGIKGPSGAPTEKDRFHVLLPAAGVAQFKKRDGSTYSAQYREAHPSFVAFNTAQVERRTVVPARLAHARVEECWEYRLQAQVLPGIAHPRRAPACMGDGKRAQRWDPKAESYTDIPCPAERCPFSRPPADGKPTPCKPWMRFLARFDWPRVDGKGLPNVPFRYASGSWNTVKNFLGFFESFRANCRNLGVDPDAVLLFGLPVALQLQERTDPSAQHRFPVVSITVAGDGDLLAWILAQGERVQALRDVPRVLALTEIPPESAGDDYDLVNAGSIPAGK